MSEEEVQNSSELNGRKRASKSIEGFFLLCQHSENDLSKK